MNKKNKRIPLSLSLSESEERDLIICCETFGISKLDAIRWAIADLHMKSNDVVNYYNKNQM